MSIPKQVIVMRTDLRNQEGHKIRTGKLIAQGAHASMKAILDVGTVVRTHPQEDNQMLIIDITPAHYPERYGWLTDKFTKVCVSVKSEEELLAIHQAAVDAGIKCTSLILDAGLTEFGGVATYTCCAIGPDFPENIDPITSHLKLF
jgi:PTH2 family peptidyl-tRNA hydrolase